MSDLRKETAEALAAAHDARESLQEVSDLLDSAHNWGVWDILGGGWISSLVKHSKVEKASAAMARAKAQLERLRSEVQDVQDLGVDLHTVEMGGLLSITDIWFDNVFSDVMAQQRINESRRQVAALIGQVDALIWHLERL